MKNKYLYGLGALLLGGGLSSPANAQNQARPSYTVGSSQELVRQLESQVATAQSRRAAPTVTLRVSGNQTLVGKVNHREALDASGEYVVGEIQNVPGSSFLLRIEGNVVQGNIILRQTRQAYQYSADERGTVRVQPIDIDKLLCVDYNQPVGYRNPAPQTDNTASKVSVISLQSFPGARGCIMLDFDGQYVSGTPWNNGNPINAAPAGMTDAAIQEFWELVSEDFRPFNMNVTTDEAVFNSYPKTMRMRCIVTPTNTAAPGAGGVAYLTSFNWNDDTPCWVFMTSPKAGGEAASHEVGHTLGLSHDGRLNPKEEYYDARTSAGNWAPIMGAGYYKPVTHWSRGEYASASQTQDDLAIMASATYNVGYRNDDHSNSISGATALARNGTSVSGSGIIERTSDQDYFTFTCGTGTVNLNLNTVGRHGDLDIVGRLFDGSGAQIGTFDTQGSLSTTLSANLTAGTYYLQIDGTSYGNPVTEGYSDYGSLGTFSISGTAPAGGTVAGVATMYKDCNYTGTAVNLPAGDYNLAALQSRGILNDDISSLTVNSGYQVVVYENDNFGGAALTLTASNSCLVNNPLGTGNWNDKATSLRVQPAASSFSVTLQAEAASVNNGMTAEACTDAGGGQNMGYVDAGDYLVWNGINFPTTGQYLIEYRVASGGSGGTISSDLNAGTIQFGNTPIPGTGGWQNWTTVSRTVTVNAGTYNFGIYAQSGGWNVNWVRISRVGSARAANQGSVAQAAAVLDLYPNPVTDQLQIHSDRSLASSEYQILDAWGKVVAQGSAATGRLNVSGLQPGSYTLRLVIDGQVQPAKRFLK
ncbi:carbohydrate-binding protein [Hymenobacter cellulosivorans]|uniref:Carbohydrate-binding protein n=1 Tax=Hymenobacter cellulosivorans TaxID=2932249 RepID=A0ABY4F9A0_9BACT|nr:carbohydrate-binding protein [Hymenobacter cellulosivorans]UOQ53100.1 carbohydrate-binding protein [Hymenobacter cellulosivorans]